MNLKQYIIDEGLKLGFSKIGVTPAEYDPVRHNAFLNWINKGLHGGMKYLERRTRARFDPRVHLPGAKSVLVCAQNYYNEPTDDPSRGYVSIHARGLDYHDVVKDKLISLCNRIRDVAPDLEYVAKVDSSTISEKTLAVKAGIGFIGKNSLLIIPKSPNKKSPPLGSFYFLGIIISNLMLEPDSPAEGTCGKCKRCIAACPTQAIVEDGKIDARKCISYHNSSSKSDIPEPLAGRMKNMVYGCDICQLVCPYNSRSTVTTEPRLRSKEEYSNIDIRGLLDLDIYQFIKSYDGTCLGAFGYEGVNKNFRNALNNLIKSNNS